MHQSPYIIRVPYIHFIIILRGIWKQDIRLQSNITQAALDKILKMLEQRLLIKSVRSIGSKTKRFYMLCDVTPGKN